MQPPGLDHLELGLFDHVVLVPVVVVELCERVDVSLEVLLDQLPRRLDSLRALQRRAHHHPDRHLLRDQVGDQRERDPEDSLELLLELHAAGPGQGQVCQC